MSIEVRNLSHTYAPDTPFQAVAVHDISFTLGDGELVGLIGHTGSGKTTLVQHLNGLMKPTTGSVVVDGVDLAQKGADLAAIRKEVGLVFQYPEYQLFEESVLKDIAFGPLNMGLGREEAEARSREAALLVGLPESVLEQSPFDLSGGQKRRVAIAGVLAMTPSTHLLDEPAAGLDPAGRREMLDLLRSLHASRGLTLVMVSHSMTDVARLCRRVLVITVPFGHGRHARKVFPTRELKPWGWACPGNALALALREAGFPSPRARRWRMWSRPS